MTKHEQALQKLIERGNALLTLHVGEPPYPPFGHTWDEWQYRCNDFENLLYHLSGRSRRDHPYFGAEGGDLPDSKAASDYDTAAIEFWNGVLDKAEPIIRAKAKEEADRRAAKIAKAAGRKPDARRLIRQLESLKERITGSGVSYSAVIALTNKVDPIIEHAKMLAAWVETVEAKKVKSKP